MLLNLLGIACAPLSTPPPPPRSFPGPASLDCGCLALEEQGLVQLTKHIPILCISGSQPVGCDHRKHTFLMVLGTPNYKFICVATT